MIDKKWKCQRAEKNEKRNSPQELVVVVGVALIDERHV